MSGRRVGIEVDGCAARLVEIDGDNLIGHRSAGGATPSDAVRAVLGSNASRFADGVATLAWTGAVDFVRLTLQPAPPEAWRAAMIAAAEEELYVSEDDMAVAGSVSESANGTLSAVAGVASADAIGGLWDVARTLGLAITLPQFCLAADGCYLAIRDESADLTVVSDGRAVASRSLDGGSLGALLAALHPGPATARERLMGVVTGRSELDAGASTIVDAHVARLAGQVAELVRAWRQQSIRTGEVVFTVGAGATMPSLPARLRSAGLRASAPPLPERLDLSDVPTWDRFGYFGALMAAMYGPVRGDAAVLSNRRIDAAGLRAAHAAAARSRVIAAGCAVLVAAGALVVPVAVSRARVAAANHRQTDALERFAKVRTRDAELAHVAAGRAIYARSASGDVRWAEMHRALAASLPPAAVVEALRFSRQAGVATVDISISFTGDPFTDVSTWAGRMRALNVGGADRPNEVTIRLFSYDRDTRAVRASLTALIALRAPFVETRTLS